MIRRHAVPAGLLALLFLALGLPWALATPVTEPPDEAFHLWYATHLARTGNLPVVDPPRRLDVPVEGNQPPLYYALGALALKAGGLGDLTYGVPPRNPRSNKVGGPEVAVYDHTDSDFPWARAGRAATLLRILFLPLGAVVVLGAYAAALAAWPGREAPPVLAAGFVATLPQFTFIMTSVTNDALANALAASALAFMAWLVAGAREGPLLRRPDRTAVALGLLLAVGLWTKMTLVYLLPLSLVAWYLARMRPGDVLRGGGITLLVAVVLAAPVFYRNFAISGDPTGVGVVERMFADSMHDPGLYNWGEAFFLTIIYSFWGVFGHMNLYLGEIYALFAGLLLATAAGLLLSWLKDRGQGADGRVLVLMGVAFTLVFLAVIRFNMSFPQAQGRYLFPGLVAAAVFFGGGMGRLIRHRTGAWIGVGVLVAVNVALLTLVVYPAYPAP